MSASNAGGGKSAPGIDANRSGVFRAPASLNSVRELAKKAVLAWLELSLDAVSNKLQFLDACARQLKLPVHFGGNWDALADCLRDLPPAQSAGFVLQVSGAAPGQDLNLGNKKGGHVGGARLFVDRTGSIRSSSCRRSSARS